MQDLQRQLNAALTKQPVQPALVDENQQSVVIAAHVPQPAVVAADNPQPPLQADDNPQPEEIEKDTLQCKYDNK